MKLIVSIFFAAALFFAAAVPVIAHTGGPMSPMDELMEEMMGPGTFAQMEQMEELIMGEESHERMEELMDGLFAATLTPAEQEEMAQIMRDSETGPGAQSMMTRAMMPRALSAYGRADNLGAFGMMGGGVSGGFGFFWWATAILVWAFLILGIGAFWKKLSKTSDKIE